MHAVVNEFDERKMDFSKIVSVTIDGACSMTGEENSFVFGLFTECIGHSILGFHYIIQQQILCAKASFKSLDDIMSPVTKLLVNFISART